MSWLSDDPFAPLTEEQLKWQRNSRRANRFSAGESVCPVIYEFSSNMHPDPRYHLPSIDGSLGDELLEISLVGASAWMDRMPMNPAETR